MAQELRPELLAIAQRLSASDVPVLPLDRVAEQVGAVLISSDEIDALFAWLEARGFTIGDPAAGPASSALPQVLAAARALRSELSRTPNAREIAARAGLSLDAVQQALLFARILQRQ